MILFLFNLWKTILSILKVNIIYVYFIMVKRISFKNRAKKFIVSSSKNAEKSLPVINNNLKNVGVMAKNVAKETLPIVEKGVAAVYGTMSSGFNLGIKGAKNVASNIQSVSRKRRRQSKRSKKHPRKTHRKH